MSGSSEVCPREWAVWALRGVIRKAAAERYGAEVVETPIEGFSTLTKPTLADPLAGLGAARLARDVAVGEMLSYAKEARGAGRLWDEVAEALGIEASQDGQPRGELAFLLLVEGRLLPSEERPWWDRSTARWTCTTCGQRIGDHGPFESHPDDVEEGHAYDCARRAAALALRTKKS